MDVAIGIVLSVLFRKGQFPDRHMESLLYCGSSVCHDRFKSSSVRFAFGGVRVRYEAKRGSELFQLVKLAVRPCRTESCYGIVKTNGLHP